MNKGLITVIIVIAGVGVLVNLWLSGALPGVPGPAGIVPLLNAGEPNR